MSNVLTQLGMFTVSDSSGLPELKVDQNALKHFKTECQLLDSMKKELKNIIKRKLASNNLDLIAEERERQLEKMIKDEHIKARKYVPSDGNIKYRYKDTLIYSIALRLDKTFESQKYSDVLDDLRRLEKL